MIRKVTIKNFKRFHDIEFALPGHVVIAGPNNTGKTTFLQALASWALAFQRWEELHGNTQRRRAYAGAPVARQDFYAVPLRNFDFLWEDRNARHDIEITVEYATGERLGMRFEPNSSEQIYVRPTEETGKEIIRKEGKPSLVFIPPMTGLGTEEPVYQKPKINQLLGRGQPGEVLRNLLVEAHAKHDAWEKLASSMQEMFGYQLLPPNAAGADIRAEYRESAGRNPLDIAGAGSGFQQVLMLLCFLYTRPASVLLLDEPDAHLHVILQDAIYRKLRAVAEESQSQLIVSTHSEVVIDSVEPRELCVLLNEPKMLADNAERANLIRSLSALSNTDIMLVAGAPGILYVEGHTDRAILLAWAKVLAHPAFDLLDKKLMWKPVVWENRPGASGIKAQDHYDALTLARADLPGLMLLDGDDNPNIPDTEITGRGLQRMRWRRYEIESYLVHPAALGRFALQTTGQQQAAEDMQRYFTDNFPPAVAKDPLGDHTFLNSTKARTELLPPLLAAAGLHGFPYTRYHEIAACMLPDEIHPEVREKLDAIAAAVGERQ